MHLGRLAFARMQEEISCLAKNRRKKAPFAFTPSRNRNGLREKEEKSVRFATFLPYFWLSIALFSSPSFWQFSLAGRLTYLSVISRHIQWAGTISHFPFVIPGLERRWWGERKSGKMEAKLGKCHFAPLLWGLHSIPLLSLSSFLVIYRYLHKISPTARAESLPPKAWRGGKKPLSEATLRALQVPFMPLWSGRAPLCRNVKRLFALQMENTYQSWQYRAQITISPSMLPFIPWYETLLKVGQQPRDLAI